MCCLKSSGLPKPGLLGDASLLVMRAVRSGASGQQALGLSDLARAPPSSFRASRTQKPGRVEFQELTWPLGLLTGAITGGTCCSPRRHLPRFLTRHRHRCPKDPHVPILHRHLLPA